MWKWKLQEINYSFCLVHLLNVFTFVHTRNMLQLYISHVSVSVKERHTVNRLPVTSHYFRDGSLLVTHTTLSILYALLTFHLLWNLARLRDLSSDFTFHILFAFWIFPFSLESHFRSPPDLLFFLVWKWGS